MVPGCTFTLSQHPHTAANVEYLIIHTHLNITEISQETQTIGSLRGQDYSVSVDLDLHPTRGETYRPELTLPKPQTQLQTALVVGQEGQEIWTDEQGRIKVQFPWDRYGQKNANSSCWIRVSAPWAGNQLGATFLPRIGQEVLVDWIDGDIDLPICTGKVHNQLNKPSWKLPEQQALSGFRSRELTQDGGNASSGRSNHLLLDDTAEKIQAQLRSDHLASQLSLGHITRIENNAGRQDARGEGFELRTDGHGAVRAKNGLLITTEARSDTAAHIMDMGETVSRLTQAHDQHENLAEAAQEAKAQDEDKDQSEVTKALKAQNDDIKGIDGGGQEGKFPELQKPHLVLASPAGIESTTPKTTHLASGEHIAMTSGKHTSMSAAGSILGVAQKAIKFFAYELGMKFISLASDIEIKALKNGIHMFAAEEITLRAKKIRMVAEEIEILASKRLFTNGGGSTSEKTAASIINATGGAWVEQALNHNSPKPLNMPVSEQVPLEKRIKQKYFQVLVDEKKDHNLSYELVEKSTGRTVHSGQFNDEGNTNRLSVKTTHDDYYLVILRDSFDGRRPRYSFEELDDENV